MERKKETSFFDRLFKKHIGLPEAFNQKAYHIDLREDYKIDKSSKVYKITRKSDKKVFAMKIFKRQKEEEEKINEIEVARMIDHPFIIKVIEIIPLEDKQGMVMELADNGTFKMMI
jgi:serine/threonine protein kinase